MLYSLRRAEADRDGHHAQRGGKPRGGARVGRLGRRSRRRRFRQHRRRPSRSRAGIRRVSKCATGPDTARRRTTRLAAASHDWILSIDADERVTPGAGGGDPRAPGDGTAAPRLPHPARHVVPRAVDPRNRLVSGLPAAPLRPPGGPLERPPRARIGRARRRTRPAARTIFSTTRTATSRTTSRRSIATRRLPPTNGPPTGVARRSRRWRSTRRSRSCATTCCGAASRRASPALIVSVLNAYYVFLKFAKLWATSRAPPVIDVLPPHRHGPDVARRPEPGAADGARPARARPPAGARRASGRRAAAARAAEGLELHSDRAADRDGSLGARGSCRASSSSWARTSSTPTIRTASRWRRWRCRWAPQPGEAAARRGAARRLPPQGQRVLALEVPPGGLLHLRVRGDPPDARRRRRPGDAHRHGPRGDRCRSASPPRRPADVHEEFWLPHHAPVVGNVAALVPHKGQRHLIEAAAPRRAARCPTRGS